MSLNLSGKVFMVTGATRGLGRALTKTLSQHGSKVYALGRTEELLKSLEEKCKNVKAIQVDIGDWNDVRTKLKDIEVLDGLVNNAAIITQAPEPALDITEETMNRYFAVNVMGAINATQIVGRKMIENKRPGCIVNVSSTWSLQASKGALNYCVTKAALDMVSKQFALELGPNGIRVNSFNPTLFLSDTMKGIIESGKDLPKEVEEITPLKKTAEVEDMVSPILYLLSDMSSMVSGTTHVADGAMISSFHGNMK